VHDPLVAIRDKLRTRDAGVKPDVAAEIELVVDVVEIGANLLPRGIELAVAPIPPELLAGELIQRPVRIDPGARITVPVPDAADVGYRREPARTSMRFGGTSYLKGLGSRLRTIRSI
jgi:hypothetical protein